MIGEEKKEESAKEESKPNEITETVEETEVKDEAEPKAAEEKEEETVKEILEETEAEKTEEAEEKKPAEEAKPKRGKTEEEEEIVEERVYTIPLGQAWAMPQNKRAPKAVRIIREFVKKHMKLEKPKEEEEETEEEEPRKLVISNEVNERVWTRGIEKPPRKIRIRAAKDEDGNITVYLAEGE
jgi:large subunit ribosomal protein L31e